MTQSESLYLHGYDVKPSCEICEMDHVSLSQFQTRTAKFNAELIKKQIQQDSLIHNLLIRVKSLTKRNETLSTENKDHHDIAACHGKLHAKEKILVAAANRLERELTDLQSQIKPMRAELKKYRKKNIDNPPQYDCHPPSYVEAMYI